MTDESLPKDRYFQLDALTLHYVDWGNTGAPPMVLLHGLQDCARSWDAFAASMRSEFRVLALDHRGHGDSDWASSDCYRLSDYASDVDALFRHLGLRNVVLIGHSAGGRNAFMYAIDHADLVDSLVIVDIDPDAVNPDSQAMFNRYHAEPDEWEPLEAVVERLRSRQPNSSEDMLVHQATHMTRPTEDGKRAWKRDRQLLNFYERPDLWNEWAQIEIPTLIVRGRQSNLLTHEVAVKMAETISKVRLAELEGGGHWFYQEFPGAFEATVRWFLTNLPAK